MYDYGIDYDICTQDIFLWPPPEPHVEVEIQPVLRE